jgi:hypothetical protein
VRTTANPRAAIILISLIAGSISVLPAAAGVKGARGTNGQHTRPFYIVAHNPNALSEVDQALAAGANALEPDIMKFSDGTTVFGTSDHVNSHADASGLFVYHDDVTTTTRLPVTVEAYFDHVHDAVLRGSNIALITLDIKSPAAPYVHQLREAVRSHLNHDGVRINIIYSVGTLDDAAFFSGSEFLSSLWPWFYGQPPFPSALEDHEGIMVDGENEAPTVLHQLLTYGGIRHVAFGNGSFGISSGFAPNVVPSLDTASYLRAAKYWDEGQYTNGGTGLGVAIPYAYPIPIGSSTAISGLAAALLNNVDGLIPDADFQPQIFSMTVDQIRYLKAYIDANPDRYLATAADNPFYVPPEAYALAVGTDSGLFAGTKDTITFTLIGTAGSASVSVDGNFLHRFHSGEMTHVTLPSKNLGRLTGLQLSSNGTDDWEPTTIQVNSIRWGIPLREPTMFGTNPNPVLSFKGASNNSTHSSSVPIVDVGHDSDGTPPHANPTVTPSPNAAGWNHADVTVTWNWADEPGGSGLRTVVCTGESITRSEGVQSLQATCSDKEGNEGVGSQVVRIDKTRPTVSCGAADGAWHSDNVSIACKGSDGISGLAHSADASFNLATVVPSGVETAQASTGSRTVADRADNSTVAGPIGGNKIDRKAPVITIGQPSAATQYTHADTLRLAYSVTDAGSGVASVAATLNGSATVAGSGLPSGRDIPLLTTTPLGPNRFEIQAADRVGNHSVSVVTFNVIATPQSLLADLAQLQGHGLDQRGNSLSSKLTEAGGLFAAGKCTAARQVYNAFVNEVTAQTGKSITPAAAAILIGDALYVSRQCR